MLFKIHDSLVTLIKTDTLIENLTLQLTLWTPANKACEVSGAGRAGQRVTLLTWTDHQPTPPPERKL